MLRKRNHTVYECIIKEYLQEYCLKHESSKETVYNWFKQVVRFPLSEITKDYPSVDVVIVENSVVLLENDLKNDTLVIYYHKDLFSPFYCSNPDVLLYRFTRHPDVCKRTVPEHWKSIKCKYVFLHAADRERFLPQDNKTIKGLSYIGIEYPIEVLPYKSSFHVNYYSRHLKIYEHCKSRGFLNLCQGKTTGVHYYTKMMPQCEAIIVIPAHDAHETRRVYEAALSKTLVVLYIQDDVAQNIFEKMGFVYGRSCLTFRNEEELDGIAAGLKNNVFHVKYMVDRAYDIAWKFHTYFARVKQLESIIREVKNEYLTHLCVV